MTCKRLGGACDQKFHADTFEEIAQMSKNHGMEMLRRGDAPHQKAMQDMQALMQSPEALKEWFDKKRREFKALPED